VLVHLKQKGNIPLLCSISWSEMVAVWRPVGIFVLSGSAWEDKSAPLLGVTFLLSGAGTALWSSNLQSSRQKGIRSQSRVCSRSKPWI